MKITVLLNIFFSSFQKWSIFTHGLLRWFPKCSFSVGIHPLFVAVSTLINLCGKCGHFILCHFPCSDAKPCSKLPL